MRDGRYSGDRKSSTVIYCFYRPYEGWKVLPLFRWNKTDDSVFIVPMRDGSAQISS